MVEVFQDKLIPSGTLKVKASNATVMFEATMMMGRAVSVGLTPEDALRFAKDILLAADTAAEASTA